MEDRRSSFPTHDPEPERNILDGPWMRTENEPIEVIHKRYYILLVVGVLLVGFVSFLSPVGMMRALHYDKENTDFSYTVVSSSGEIGSSQEALPLDCVDILKTYSTSHIIQKDAVFDSEGILIYPSEDTNYALYVSEDTSYIFAVDKNKFRYQVKDDGTLYQALTESLKKNSP